MTSTTVLFARLQSLMSFECQNVNITRSWRAWITGPPCTQVYHRTVTGRSNECSKLCRCLANATVVCRPLPCVKPVQCTRHNKVYGQSASVLQLDIIISDMEVTLSPVSVCWQDYPKILIKFVWFLWSGWTTGTTRLWVTLTKSQFEGQWRSKCQNRFTL